MTAAVKSFLGYQVGLQAFHNKTVCHIASINRLSCDRSCVVVAQGYGPLAWFCAHTRNIEQGEVTLLTEQEAMIHVASVNVISGNCP